MDFQDKNHHWISMLEASRLCAYSQEYLSLLARRGKIFSKKLGRNWYTTREAVDDYLKTQSVFISLPKNIFGRLNTHANLAAALTPEEPEKREPVEHAQHSKIFEEFERLNPQISFGAGKEIKLQTPVVTQPEVSPIQKEPLRSATVPIATVPDSEENVLKKLDKLSDSLGIFAERVVRKLEEPKEGVLTPEQKEFFNEEISSFAYRLKTFDRYARSMMRNPVRMMTIMITAIVAIFIIAGGFSFGQADYVVQRVKKAFKDADTVQGHFPGTHANEVLVLDKSGNVSIFGHIETQGQFRSYAPDGVAPMVVDSMTLVENLNANYLDGLASKDFTLAFVTKNGNLTYEDVRLEGNVEVGKTLSVKGAAKLLDSLQVYGNLGVFGDAVFGKDIILQKGTIKISNTSLIKNLNAEFLDGIKKQNINLDFVTSNGASTPNGISIGALEVSGQSDFRAPGFFYEGIWGSDGTFGTLGVAGDTTVGSQDKPKDSRFTVYSKYFSVNNSGNASIGGTLTAGDTTVSDLTVGGSVISDLIPSGSYDLGSSANPWANLFATNANLTTATVANLIVSGSAGFAGTTSSSFKINTDNATAAAEDSYLAFERGATTPNATLKWNSTQNRFEFNEPLFVASSSAETIFSVSGGPASISNTLYVQNSGNVGINYGGNLDTKFEVGGTASISGAMTTSTITASGLLSFSGTNHAGLKINNLTTAERDLLTPASGMTIFNTTVTKMQVYNGTSWKNVGNPEIGAEVTSGTAGSVLFVDASGNLGQDNDNFYWDVSNARLGIGTTSPATKFEVQGTASASYLLTGNTLQVGGYASAAYSRFGTSTTGHPNYISSSNDLLISGDLETRGTASFGGVASVSGNFFTYGTNTFSGTGSSSFAGSLDITKGLRAVEADFNNILVTTSGGGLTFNGGGTNIISSTGTLQINAFMLGGALNANSNNISSINQLGFTNASGSGSFELGSSASKLGVNAGALTDTMLEVGGTASISGALTTYGTNTFSGTGSSSFAGSLDISKGLRAGANTAFTVQANASANSLFVANSGNVGIGTAEPGTKLHVHQTAAASTAEELARFTVSDDASSYLKIDNFNSTDSLFTPQFHGYYGGATQPGLTLYADALSDTGTVALMQFKSTVAGGAVGTRPLFQWLENTSPVVTIDNAGNVGIGTTAPAHPLHIELSSADLPVIRLTSTGNANPAQFGRASNVFSSATSLDLGISYPAGKNLFFGESDGSVTAVMDASGNVGIGTTSPDSLLELSSTATNFIIRSTGSTSSASIDFQPAGGASTSNQGKFTIRAGGLGGSAERLDFINANDVKLFTIASSGNVGIGTTAPAFKFEVVGDINIPTGSQYKINGVDQAFDKWSAGSGNDIYRQNGNVGIGTINVDAKFEVGGTASISGAMTTSTITASGLLSFSGTNHAGLKINNLTTAERDLLTPASGMTIFNTTVTKMQVYNGPSWKNVGNPEIRAEVTSGTAGSVLFVDASGNLGQDNDNFYWDVTNK